MRPIEFVFTKRNDGQFVLSADPGLDMNMSLGEYLMKNFPKAKTLPEKMAYLESLGITTLRLAKLFCAQHRTVLGWKTRDLEPSGASSPLLNGLLRTLEEASVEERKRLVTLIQTGITGEEFFKMAFSAMTKTLDGPGHGSSDGGRETPPTGIG